MHPKQYDKKTIRIVSASNITLETLYLDSEYQRPQIESNSLTQPNGLLLLFRLHPGTPSNLPIFLGRWDFNKDTVDIDFEKGSSIDEDAFKSERDGYGGHHPVTISDNPRVFGIDIRLPGRRIFEGKMTCTIDIDATFTASLSMTAELSAKLIPGEPKS